MSEQDGVFVCDGVDLADGGRGIRFPVLAWGQPATGFVVRYDGQAYAYLNRCAHVPIELDWNEGQFFESSGLYLMCSTHGAVYLPTSGRCAGGPCRNGRLHPIPVIEKDGKIFWQPNDQFHVPA
ncbi:Rieske (2Fe-2S) protein [Massilia niastensis]|uniref:Rieske (2Fe-2S) protein n=1 Tax=Massilia niastensis TaxID=544911 RepID=UPI00035C1965|nr:Rieske 2Fe-2S domain-containing protein [Massilia niastensis]